MSYEVDGRLFNSLAQCNPLDVCRRAQCRYEAQEKQYYLSYWGDEYLIDCQKSQVRQLNKGPIEPHDYVPIFLVNYLIQVRDVSPLGTWISEKDMVGGATFFRGPHLLPTDLISSRFQNDLKGFSRGCSLLQGRLIDMADMAFVFNPIAGISVSLLYWIGDDEFPAESKILFDGSIAGMFALDTVYALAVDICSRVARA